MSVRTKESPAPKYLPQIPEPSAARYFQSDWSIKNLVGRLIELTGETGTANLIPVCNLMRQAQKLGEPVAWIAQAPTIFFPPDVLENGVDLDALIIVWAPDVRAALRSTEHLLRSGAFGLIIIDFNTAKNINQGILAKLIRIADKQETVLLCLSNFLGSMVSLRGETRLKRIAPGLFHCEMFVVKDKKTGPGWKYGEICFGPSGMY